MGRGFALAIFLVTACSRSKEPTPTITSATSATSASASAMPGDAVAPLPRATPDSHVPLGPSGTIQENRVYSVDTTPLRFVLKNAMRATPISGGHVWSGMLTVCDGNVCTDLGLSGPDQPPVAWHGYKFVLAFVMPSSLEITK